MWKETVILSALSTDSLLVDTKDTKNESVTEQSLLESAFKQTSDGFGVLVWLTCFFTFSMLQFIECFRVWGN